MEIEISGGLNREIVKIIVKKITSLKTLGILLESSRASFNIEISTLKGLVDSFCTFP